MAERKYMVVKATPKAIKGVTVEGKPMKFGKKSNAFEVNDPGLAREIEAQKGAKLTGDVVVIPHFVDKEPGHRYSFLVPELPWHRKESKPDEIGNPEN